MDILLLISNFVRVSGEKIKSGFGVFFVFAFFVLIEGSSNRLGIERLGCETNDEIHSH